MGPGWSTASTPYASQGDVGFPSPPPTPPPSHGAPAYSTPDDNIGEPNTGGFGSLPIVGRYGSGHLVETHFVRSLCVRRGSPHAGGPGSLLNPIGMRQFEDAALPGSCLIAGHRPLPDRRELFATILRRRPSATRGAAVPRLTTETDYTPDCWDVPHLAKWSVNLKISPNVPTNLLPRNG